MCANLVKHSIINSSVEFCCRSEVVTRFFILWFRSVYLLLWCGTSCPAFACWILLWDLSMSCLTIWTSLNTCGCEQSAISLARLFQPSTRLLVRGWSLITFWYCDHCCGAYLGGIISPALFCRPMKLDSK